MRVSRRAIELIFVLETLILGIGGFILCYQPGYFNLVRFLIGTALIGTAVYNMFLYTRYLGTEMSKCDYFRFDDEIEEE